MPQPIIEIKNLSKEYTLFHKLPYYTLRDTVTNIVKKPLDVLRGKAGSHEREKFLALKDINFSIQQGERVGIIGRNGAGKSTLLKILSQITPPTTGEIVLRGRVASLLEVGTGFHPELTGRENVYLNGAILGMKQKEIAKKFDEIVAFAEIEKFLDTPVKRYSSGMYVRLAFAVAAHLEPEILIVDEVLAVGDAQFQKKCLGKMEEVGKSGRTVIFVSHNMGAINQLCGKCIFIKTGTIANIGETSNVISEYLLINSGEQSKVIFNANTIRTGNGFCVFDLAELRDAQNQNQNKFSIGNDIILIFKFKRIKPLPRGLRSGVEIISADGLPIANMVDQDSGFNINTFPDHNQISINMKDMRLYPGKYSINLWLGDLSCDMTYDNIENALNFEIIGGGQLTSRILPRSAGLIFLTPEWKSQKISA